MPTDPDSPAELVSRLRPNEVQFLVARLVSDSDTQAVLRAGITSNRATAEAWGPKRRKRSREFAEACRMLTSHPEALRPALIRRSIDDLAAMALPKLAELARSKDRRVAMGAIQLLRKISRE